EAAAGGRIGEYLRSIHPDDLPMVEAAIGKAQQEGSTYLAQYRLRKNDGTWRHVIARGTVERDAAGKAAQMPGVVLDITEQVKAQEERRQISAELERSEERLRFSLEAGRIGAWDLELKNGRAWRSLEHDQIFGYPDLLPDWTYEMFLEHVVAEDRAMVNDTFEAAIAGAEKWKVECRIRRADGEVRWVTPHARVVRDLKGNPERMYGTVVDITERKEAEAAVRESEAKFRQLADSIPQLAWMADADGSIFWYNQRWYEYTGAKPEDMAGWGWQSVHDPAELPKVMTRWQASIQSGEPFDMVFPIRGADGKFRRFLTRVMPFRDQENRIALWFGTNTDVEDQNRAAEALQERREQLALALEAGQLGSWQLDLRTMKLSASEGCKANYGLADDAPFDYETQLTLIHPDDRPLVESGIRRALEKGENFAAEYRVQWPDGALHWISARGRTVAGTERGTLRLIGVTQDITELKLAEEQREGLLAAERAARAEAEHVGRMKDEFLATLSHELRTPLNAIFGWTQLIKSGGDERELVAEGIEVIDRNVRVQTQLIEDLLDMSRVISGKLRLDVQHLDPSTSINAAIETVMPAAEAKGIRIEKILDPSAGPISGDPSRLQQIIWNLLSNAIKFTRRGGKVQVRLERVNSQVEITVADTGQGISPEFLPYVFDRFRQADASTNRQHGGLGLGLAIAKQLVELHGGSIQAESAGKDQGTSFVVSLPIKVMHAHVDPAERRHPRAESEALPYQKCTDLADLKVLVVDDERDARELLRRMLENCEAEVVLAASAAEALSLLNEHAPDVLISDIGMAEIDGYEFLKKLRRQESAQSRKTPAIALTAFARSEDRTRALLAGFSAHVSKPVEPAELVATIASVVGRTIPGQA
ncbi:MAG: PAS domain-containing protein, partial [Chthoniobacterales bacterium]